MGRKLDKFVLLTWKNFLLQWRHPVQTAIEILAPVLFACMLVLIRSLVDPVKKDAIIFPPFENMLRINQTELTIPWSPKTAELEEIMEETIRVFKDAPYTIDKVSHTPLGSTEELNIYLKNEIYLKSTWAGIDFGDSAAQQQDTRENIDVTIRFPGELRAPNIYSAWSTQRLFPMYQVAGPRSPNDNLGAYPGYEREGFLFLQKHISYSIISYLTKKVQDKKFDRTTAHVNMQRFSYSGWTDDILIQALQTFVGLIFMLGFVYTCINTVKVITAEKEKQLKEAMKIMGLPGWLHWTAWFIKTFVFLLISIIIMIVIMKIPWYPGTHHTVFTYSDPFLIFIFLLLFMSATITFCFAISVFFSKANTAATVAGMAWFVSYFPYSLMQQSYETLNLSQKISSSIFSNTAMAYGFQLMLMYEGNEEGLQWNNVWKTPTPDDNLMFGHMLIMLFVDTIIYLIIALYVEAVFPGEYGVPQVWYFPLTKSYWTGKPTIKYSGALEKRLLENEFYEKEPQSVKAGIKIHNLCKEFKNNKVAVKDLSLNMYEGQITVLLGHNGAGKTTTMSMLTGMFPPSTGTALVNDCDIRTNMSGVRASLGLCPQHNILFDELTVNEHLYFYSRLKGLKKDSVEAEIQKYVEMLELQPKANAQSCTLSGGMKRKLSVAVALCGDSKVVMCDEPTAGMDPSARRALWDLLQAQKKGRTILLTTHYMDEADLLGDRIAIMAEGELQCCGSSFFLKKKYGAGYHLIMDKSTKCDANQVTALLRKYIPNIEVYSNIGSELTYILSEDYSTIFEEMLYDLETHSRELNINTYGISLTTLEEVFMKVGASTRESREIGHLNQNSDNHTLTTNQWGTKRDSQVQIGNNLLEGWELWRNQIIAMFMKRGLSLIRSWPLLIIQNVIPVTFLILAVIALRNRPGGGDLPSLKIELDAYDSPVVVVTHKTNSYAQSYMDLIKRKSGELIDWKDGNMSALMIEETEKSTSKVRSRYIIGATFHENNSITAYFNNNPLHSPPLALQTVMNAILHKEVSENYMIQFYNFPLPFTTNTMLTRLSQGTTGGFTIAFNLAFSMAFTSAFYVMFYIRERVSKSKHLQFVSGIGVLPFWCSSFIIDFVTFILTILLVIVTFAICQEEGFQTADDLGNIFAIFLYFGFSMIPMMYLGSYLFDVPSTGYTRMALFNVLVGVAGFLGVQILAQPELELVELADVVHWILLLVPQYSFSSGIRDMNLIYMTHHLCGKATDACVTSGLGSKLICKFYICSLNAKCCSMTKKYYDMEKPGIGRNVIFSCGIGVIFIATLLCIEYRIFDQIRSRFAKKLPPPGDVTHEDDDVAQEKKVIRSLSTEKMINYKLVIRDVTKYYKDFLAVNSICLGVGEKECFGLLGVNGAGKTTTFKMMTGDIPLSYGEAWVNGLSLATDMKKIHQLIGYCPQFDALLDDLTARETLTLFGLIRGITIIESKLEAEHLAYQFDFHPHLDKQIKALSGGNKRKVSTAIALIGNPQIIYLDEPTAGMDPATKRYLWDALCKVRDSGKCIILTSHSMEECEALCTRLSIMVNGTFKCLGSTQHLKTKFSEGYSLTIKVKKSELPGQVSDHELDAIVKFVKDNFQSAVVREKHQELITFYIADKSQPWSKMFGILERSKQTLNVEDYSLGQSSLEQVFLVFTKQQRE